MSIKGFHLLFITIAALFCLAFGLWILFFNSSGGGLVGQLIAGGTLFASLFLSGYGVYFYRKTKKLVV